MNWNEMYSTGTGKYLESEGSYTKKMYHNNKHIYIYIVKMKSSTNYNVYFWSCTLLPNTAVNKKIKYNN